MLHDSTRLIVFRSAYLTAAAPASLSAGGAAATAACVRILANNNKNNSDRERSHALARAPVYSHSRVLSHSLTSLRTDTTYVFVGFFFVLRVFAKNTRKIIVKFQCLYASVCVRVCVFLYALLLPHPQTGRQAEGAASRRIASHRSLSLFRHSFIPWVWFVAVRRVSAFVPSFAAKLIKLGKHDKIRRE